ncbi:MAG: hypothetical protein QOE41_356, partial [Mycobacterium sp.]|nr:hypothetical protein [Mycobacterium sp.]
MPNTATPNPATVTGRHVPRLGTVKAVTAATIQASVQTASTGRGSRRMAGSG